MIVLVLLVPVALIGLIAWIAVGIRQRATEPFTLPGGASFYAHLLTIVSVTTALLGIAVGIKVFVGFLNLNYSYSASLLSSLSTSLSGLGTSSPPTPPSDLTPHRTDDLALAITLFAVGVLLFVVHRLLARSVRRLPGGLPGWVQKGTIIGFTVLYASAAVFGLIAGAYGVVTYIINPADATSSSALPPQPFGDVVGAAGAFIPAWIVTVVMLARRSRRPAPAPPTVSSG
jgi:hypothetical protein